MKISTIFKVSLMLGACLPISNLCYGADASAPVVTTNTDFKTSEAYKGMEKLVKDNAGLVGLTDYWKNLQDLYSKNPTEGTAEITTAWSQLNGKKSFLINQIAFDFNARLMSKLTSKRSSISSPTPVTPPPARTHSPSVSEKNSPRVHQVNAASAASAKPLSNQLEQSGGSPKLDIATSSASGLSSPIPHTKDKSADAIIERMTDGSKEAVREQERRQSNWEKLPKKLEQFLDFFDKHINPLIKELPANVKSTLEQLDEYTRDRLAVALYEGYLRNLEDLHFAAELLNRMQTKYLDMLKLNTTKAEELQAELLDMLNGLCNGQVRIEDLKFIADKTSPEDQDAALYHALKVNSSVWPIIRTKNMSIDAFIKVASASTPAEQRKIASGVDTNWFDSLKSYIGNQPK